MLQLIQAYLPVFLLVFVRLSTFIVSAPIFSMRGVPNQFKIGFAFMMAIISFSYVKVQTAIPLDLMFTVYVIKEALIGLMLGFLITMFFNTVRVAGGLMDMQMGFAMANVMDPATGAYVPITGRFKDILATLYFFSINGHHLMIKGILMSYQTIAVDKMWVPIESGEVFAFVTQAFSHMFLSAFLIAAPIVVALFLVDLSLGIIAKTVPQFNIFVVGLPIKIFASFVMLIVVMPVFFVVISGLFEKMFLAMSEMMKLLGG
ncbi:flagellar biosynthetic protein FliR [Brevibacillus dissolubilis]|uniref:flagellar biosynthetic protein FliR n=1 Tax=Brevibacillus dissolubilis TaxID=1844116 RepID=UPI001117AD57|nr:flagellar biosynthetic protein FliR [Brevibacillus dissolubilis]